MKLNPVYKRELTVSGRSIRLALIFMFFNGILAVVALFNMYSVVEQVKVTAEIQYSRFLELYVFVSGVEFIMLMFIMPALTASSISGERERQTLDLMLTTTMAPGSIISGKLCSALTTMLLLVMSGIPVQSLVFVYGGITIADMVLLFICYGAVALLAGGIGIFFSSLIKKSTVATVCTYVTIIILVAGTYAVNVFSLRMSQNEINSYMSTVNTVTKQATSGGFVYLLLLNPAVTFYTVINQQAGSGSIRTILEGQFGQHPDNFIMAHWTGISLVCQLLIALILIGVAVYTVSAVRGNANRTTVKKRKEQKHAENRLSPVFGQGIPGHGKDGGADRS